MNSLNTSSAKQLQPHPVTMFLLQLQLGFALIYERYATNYLMNCSEFISLYLKKYTSCVQLSVCPYSSTSVRESVCMLPHNITLSMVTHRLRNERTGFVFWTHRFLRKMADIRPLSQVRNIFYVCFIAIR